MYAPCNRLLVISPTDKQARCQLCVTDNKNVNLYFADPCNCSNFYQCAYSPSLNAYWTYLMPCPPCQCFDNVVLQCLPRNASTIYTDPSCANLASTAASSTCPLYAVASDPSVYYVDAPAGQAMMDCPAGTVFSAVKCTCIIAGGKCLALICQAVSNSSPESVF